MQFDFAILIIGFGLGMLHALDADHVMALVALYNQKSKLRKVAFFSTYWAIGHGTVLLVCGILLTAFGVLIPESLQWVAEFGVGVLLFVIGIVCVWQLRKTKLQIHSHGDIQHVHWHTHEHAEQENQDHAKSSIKDSLVENHKPLLVGMVHGLAGSAPVLALVPAVNQGQVLPAVIYLCLFSVGMMISMAVFGLSFAYGLNFLQARFQKVFNWGRYVIAALSIGLGVFWMVQATTG